MIACRLLTAICPMYKYKRNSIWTSSQSIPWCLLTVCEALPPPHLTISFRGGNKSQMVRSVFGIAPTLWRPSPSSSGSIHEQQYLFMLTLVPFNDILIFVSTATRSGHYSLLRRGSRAGGYRRDVLQQLLPLFALSAGPGPHGCPQPLGTQREAHPGEIHPPSSALTPPGPTITAT